MIPSVVSQAPPQGVDVQGQSAKAGGVSKTEPQEKNPESEKGGFARLFESFKEKLASPEVASQKSKGKIVDENPLSLKKLGVKATSTGEKKLFEGIQREKVSDSDKKVATKEPLKTKKDLGWLSAIMLPSLPQSLPSQAQAQIKEGLTLESEGKALKKGGKLEVLVSSQRIEEGSKELKEGLDKLRPILEEEPKEPRKIHVVDRRTDGHNQVREDSIAHPLFELEPVAPEVQSNDDVKILFQTSSTVVPEGSSERGSAPVSREMASQLAQQLQERGHLEIVEQARIILRDQNQGEIRLVLHPASLGRVRISLSMHENHLAGKIFVENGMVKEVFQGQLEQLSKSFAEAGYDSVRLEVNVSSEQGGSRDEYRPEQVQLYENALNLSAEAVPGGNSSPLPLSVQDGMNRLNIMI